MLAYFYFLGAAPHALDHLLLKSIDGRCRCHLVDNPPGGFREIIDAEYSISAPKIGAHYPLNIIETVFGPRSSKHTFNILVHLTILSYNDSVVICNYHTVRCTSDIPCGQGSDPESHVKLATRSDDRIFRQIAQT